MRTHRILTHAVLCAGLFAALPSSPAAQVCFGSDQLNGPCWDPAFADLPHFQDFALDGSGFQWDQCAVAAQDALQLRFDVPVSIGCGQFEVEVDVIDTATGTLVLNGIGRLDYTRTWDETNNDPLNPQEWQVWRLVAKIDFRLAAPPGFLTSYVPNSLLVHPTAFFYGYVDYALNCTTGLFDNTAVLYKACDYFLHFPGLSSQGGIYDPTQYYALVAPDTAANPFSPTPSVPPAGLLHGEGLRNVAHPTVPGACSTEDPLENGVMDLYFRGCICSGSFSAINQSVNRLQGEGLCLDPVTLQRTSFQSLFHAPLHFLDFTRTTLGNWTTANTYPGKESVYAGEGLFLYQDMCAGSAAGTGPLSSLDMFYGATTAEGFEVTTILVSTGDPLGQNFTDLASNYSRPLTAVTLPLYGEVHDTDHLIYVNTVP